MTLKLQSQSLTELLQDIRSCQHCEKYLPLGAKPVLRANSQAKLLIIGQAPGTKVHDSGIPWDDASGARLRSWLNISKQQFYDESQVAIVPMGFCYPGKGKSGDNPPRPECAPLWHEALLNHLPKLKLTLLIGQYAQNYYCDDKLNLTQRVKQFQSYLPHYLPLPHPSPRNNIWLKKNPWFELELLPVLKNQVQTIVWQ